MIPITEKKFPEPTDALKQAVRDRTQFTVPDIDVSGRWSTYQRKIFFVQCGGSLIALYDREAEQWFIRELPLPTSMEWTREFVLIALDGAKVIEQSSKELKNVQRYGYLELVRKRLNVAKEK